MTRPFLLSLLLLFIIAGGGMLLLSSPALEYPLSSDPFLPLGTITTWLFLLALPLLGWMLLRPAVFENDERGPDIPEEDAERGIEEETDAAPRVHRRRSFLQRLGTALSIIGILLALFWPLVSRLLAGNWAFAFSGRGGTAIPFGIFIGYTAFTFLLGVLSILTSFRPRM